MAETYVVYSENLMLFDHFGGHFAFWAPNDQNSTGFIRYFEQLFCKLQNIVLLMLFDDFEDTVL